MLQPAEGVSVTECRLVPTQQTSHRVTGHWSAPQLGMVFLDLTLCLEQAYLNVVSPMLPC